MSYTQRIDGIGVGREEPGGWDEPGVAGADEETDGPAV